MSRTFHHGERRVRVRGVRRRNPDLRKLARALIQIAQAQAEADAAQAHRDNRAEQHGRSRRKETGDERR